MDSWYRKAQRGFTLIELMVVVSIIALIVMIGMYTYISQIREVRVRGDARAIYETMELAKMRAISTGVPHGVAFWRPNKYFVFSDCNWNLYYDDTPNNDPADNSPPGKWTDCTPAGINYDPLVEGQYIEELSDGTDFDTVFGWSQASDAPGELESVVFTNLGQAMQSQNTFIPDAPIVILNQDQRGSDNIQGRVTVLGPSGVVDILPVRHNQ